MKLGTTPKQQSKMFKHVIEKVNWNLNSKDPKEHAQSRMEPKSIELKKKADEDRKKNNLSELTFLSKMKD